MSQSVASRTLRRGKVGVLLLLAVCLCRPALADENWLGRKFMPKLRCAPTINGKVVARGIISAPLVPSKVTGDSLWIGRAWVKKDEVVPLEEAVAYYNKVLAESDPKSAAALDYRGFAKSLLGNTEGAAEDWNQAIKLDPKYANAYSSRAAHLLNLGKLDAALKDMDVALELQPANSNFLSLRSKVRVLQREWDAALLDANEALRHDPQSSVAFHNRAMVWQLGKGEWKKALADYDESIRLNPENFAAYANRALIRATSPDERFRNGRQALWDAMRTCQSTDWKNPKCVRTLAAAHAELGQFEEARRWQKKAIELAGQDEVLLTEFRAQFEKYRANEPLRLSPQM